MPRSPDRSFRQTPMVSGACMRHHSSGHGYAREETMNIQTFLRILGTTFVLIGIAGTLTGTHAHNLVIFGINMSHNAVHVVTGIAAIAASGMGAASSVLFCRVFGLVYGLVTVAGFAGFDPVVRMLNLNTADNWLHLGVSASCLAYGFGGRKRRRRTRPYHHQEAMAA
jgi:hypothetical protein